MAIAQAEIARVLGVGIIPVREAFRRLQQEGLIDAQPDRRAFVAHMEPEEQDALWADRVLIETLAVRMSAGKLSTAELDSLANALETMALAAKTEDAVLFGTGHREFHAVAGAYAGPAVNNLVVTIAEKTTRYLLLHDKRVPHSYEEAVNDHRDIYRELVRGDPDAAGRATGVHIGRPALILLAQVVPSFEPKAVRAALIMTGSTDYLNYKAHHG